MQSVSTKILASIADDGLPVVNLQEYAKLTPQFFSAMFASLQSKKNFSFEDYDNVISAMSENKLSIVPESLFLADGNKQIFQCILKANAESKPFDEKAVEGMIPINANVFKDNNSTIWKVVGEGEHRQLVQVSAERYDELLDARRSRHTTVADAGDYYVQVADGNYAYFFNHETGAMDFGTVFEGNDSNFVLSTSSKKAVKVHPSQILEAATDDNEPQEMRKDIVFVQKRPIKDYLEFVAQLHSKKSVQYRNLEKMIKDSQYRIR